MNIFVLDHNIQKCAQYHCDQHVVKMILESAQMLCTVLNKQGRETPYKSTHPSHPCVLWLEESYDNFLWLVELAEQLNLEYRARYQKDHDHKSMAVVRQVKDMSYQRKGLTEFAQAMPDEFKVPGDAVQAYRNFYAGEKMRFAKWKQGNPPAWLSEPQLKAS